ARGEPGRSRCAVVARRTRLLRRYRVGTVALRAVGIGPRIRTTAPRARRRLHRDRGGFMTLALGLLAAAALIGGIGPVYLRSTISPRVHPGVALSCWAVSVLLAIGCAVTGAVLLALPQHAAVDGLIGMTAACVNSGEQIGRASCRARVWIRG